MTEESTPPGPTRFSRLFQSTPGLQVLRCYQANNLAPDILAGLVVCLVLIPSALAYAGPSDLNHLFSEEATFSQKSDAVAAVKARTGPGNEGE